MSWLNLSTKGLTDEINLKLTQNHEQLHQNDTNEESVDDHVPETLFPKIVGFGKRSTS